ncbi:MAG: radical SAM protein [Candidatus Omnitrophota bacterium]
MKKKYSTKLSHPVDSIMLMMTAACQMRCSYCEVKQVSNAISEEIMRDAIALLLTTNKKECQVRFWGGEPLLKWDLVKKGIAYGKKQALKNKKNIKFMITTNGLLLTPEKISFLKSQPVEIMLSLDGNLATNATNRTCNNANDRHENVYKNLIYLINSGINYFVNMVVSPNTLKDLSKNLLYFKSNGVKRVQLCYQCGITWTKKEIENFFNELKNFEHSNLDSFLMNLNNNCEPTMLSQEILVYPDGKIYFDAAIFLENKFQSLKKNLCLGSIKKIKKIDSLYKSKKELYRIFMDSCPMKQRKIFLNNVNLGIELNKFLQKFSTASIRCNEHPKLIPIIKDEFRMQRHYLSPLGITAVFLYVQGPCSNNCIFCSKKESISFEDIFILEHKIKTNLRQKHDKLCLIGNEPLLHPEIISIIKIAKKNGFKDIEILTSGELLADLPFLKRIVSAGATSFSMPIFGVQSRQHDLIVGKMGSHKKIIAAIKNIQQAQKNIFLHTNLLKQNIDTMLELENFVKNVLKASFIILPIRPKTSNLPFDQLAPSLNEMLKKMNGVTTLLGFPLCISNKIQKNIIIPSDNISDSMKLYFLDQKFIKTKKCFVCLYAKRCSGFFRETYNFAENRNAISPFLNEMSQ